MIQRRPAPSAATERDGTVDPSSVPSGGGSSLAAGMQDLFGRSLGADLDDVRVHTDAAAAAFAADQGAQAVTVGADIFFGAGHYRPETREGAHLLAHEVAHTVQQQGASTSPQARLEVGSVTDPAEAEADRAADAMIDGGPAYVTPLAGPRAQRQAAPVPMGPPLPRLTFAGGLTSFFLPPGASARPTPVTLWNQEMVDLEIDSLTFDTPAFRADLAPGPVATRIAALSLEAIDIHFVPQRPGLTAGQMTVHLRNGPAITLQIHGFSHDQHVGTQRELDSATTLAVRNEVNPGAAVAAPAPAPGPAPAPLPPAPTWDGSYDGTVTGSPARAIRDTKRAELRAALNAALTAHLANVRASMVVSAAAPRAPLTALEGPANAARGAVDAVFGSVVSAGAASPLTVGARHGFTYSNAAGTLLDANDPADRARAGVAVNAESVTWWMVLNDVAATGAMGPHHFDSSRTEEETWLATDIVTPFAAAHTAELERYDQFGFAMAPRGAARGTIMLPTTLDTSLGTGSPMPGMPSLALRHAQWGAWKLAVHEYIHTLEHPAFQAANPGNPVLSEGFCEYFTRQVLTARLPGASTDLALILQVEGGLWLPPTNAAMTGAYQIPPDYADNLRHADAIAATVPGGDNAMRAAFFQGHVEMLGMLPDGTFPATRPAVVDATRVRVPAGIVVVSHLALASGVTEAEILAANPGITPPMLPPQVNLPGCREHRVVVDGATPETPAQIAAQNGITEAQLRTANPLVVWTALRDGDILLIPRH